MRRRPRDRSVRDSVSHIRPPDKRAATHQRNQNETRCKGGEGAVPEDGGENAPQEGGTAEAQGEAKQNVEVLKTSKQRLRPVSHHVDALLLWANAAELSQQTWLVHT